MIFALQRTVIYLYLPQPQLDRAVNCFSQVSYCCMAKGVALPGKGRGRAASAVSSKTVKREPGKVRKKAAAALLPDIDGSLRRLQRRASDEMIARAVKL